MATVFASMSELSSWIDRHKYVRAGVVLCMVTSLLYGLYAVLGRVWSTAARMFGI